MVKLIDKLRMLNEPEYRPFCDNIKCKDPQRVTFVYARFVCPACGREFKTGKAFIKIWLKRQP